MGKGEEVRVRDRTWGTNPNPNPNPNQVIQQGRLAETSKALSKDEMLSMIRFGAGIVQP